MKTTETNEATAAELRAKAAQCDQQAHDSFERCDTDGFLSQWADGITAELCRAKAEIVENGGKADLPMLFEGDTLLQAREVEGKFGTCWVLNDADAERFGRRFLPWGPRSRIHKNLGIQQRRTPVWAVARTTGSGTGLSGCATVRVITTHDWTRIRAEWAAGS